MKMLLVDDDEWIRDSLSLFCMSEGFYLMAVETAEEGIKALKKQDYDIIISDYKLPGMDGLEFLKWTLGHSPNVSKILITDYKNEFLVSEAMKIGVIDIIEKPFTYDMIKSSFLHLIDNEKNK